MAPPTCATGANPAWIRPGLTRSRNCVLPQIDNKEVSSVGRIVCKASVNQWVKPKEPNMDLLRVFDSVCIFLSYHLFNTFTLSHALLSL